ncbi:Pescadillo homolog [Seminavis robusta]|uniref:Pescadillo homolog n=1 Tax=Seminavis robusta TaxID=568900 RepID=A0A9N8E9P1_9STRA|nr:Pescadillo homolog [Seminavis robusta]|eukprot:Sro810_g205800.1 Pescadillo homolog (716) ;mRNA; r:33372-35637
MGNRTKGRPKQKSIKAASHSGMGSKRKLSRMGKKQKKHHSGLDATFIGRTACVKRLQVTLKDFRRLCILKGIYPRQPLGRIPKNKKGQTFYHIKDIKAIAHEPVLEKFREFRAFMKKIRRAAGRNERDEAARKNAIVPTYSLHHLVKERYPRFVDALNDLDDALTLIYLFAALPSEGAIKAKVTNKAKVLAASWGAYCSTTFCITKSFISVKGIYLEASIQGSTIRWVVPHSFTQFLPEDVDYKVMQTFFEFYETLLDFVLFKLYNDIGVRYPMPVEGDPAKLEAGSKSAILSASLKSLKNALNSSTGAIGNAVTKSVETAAAEEDEDAAEKQQPPKKNQSSKKSKELIKSVGEALSKVEEDDNDEEAEDDDEDAEEGVDVAGPLKAALESMAEEEDRKTIPGGNESELNDDALKRKHLFAGLTFFLSREIPRGYLELVCLAYGGSVGWEGDDSPISAKDPKITHHIVDRPKLPASYNGLPKSREFVQPQWILDCANFMYILPIAKYAVGVTLPPHLSPWVDDEEEGYKPAYAEYIERLKNGESVEEIEAEELEAKILASKKEQEDESSSEDEENENDNRKAEDEEPQNDKDDEEEEDEEQSEESDQDEEKAKKNKNKKRKKEEDEAHDLAKVMMSRKASRLYGRMQRGIAQKKASVEILHKRRKALDDPREKGSKTVLKQKVERLKDERKDVERAYAKTGGSMKKSKKKKHQQS